jgi:hypothetical protein
MPASYHDSVYSWYVANQALLHGAGDANGDGRVSIQEAFQWAADHVPAMTADQSQGVQHPVIAGGDGSAWFLG